MEGFKKYDWINKEGQPTEEGKYLVVVENSLGGKTILVDEWKDSNFVETFRTVLEFKKYV